MKQNHFESFKLVLVIILVILFVYFVFENSSLITDLVSGYGPIGFFIASIIANASIFLPVPIDILLFVISAESPDIISVLILGVLVGFGAAIGEMTAYIMGLLGVKAAERAKNKEFKQIGVIRKRLHKSGMYFIFLGALTPFPFDIVGITCGLIKYDPKKFFIAAVAGKVFRYLIIGIAGFYSLGFIKDFFLI